MSVQPAQRRVERETHWHRMLRRPVEKSYSGGDQLRLPMQNREPEANDLVGLTTKIVEAYVQKNMVVVSGLPELIRNVHATLTDISSGVSTSVLKPAVPIRKSVFPDHIVCLEDGKKLTMLKRYLRSKYGLSPEDYRSKWNLPPDYPMVAPNYSTRRSDFAKKIGLGRSSKKTKGKRV
jgi:predicted transcriptional regulator